MWGYVVGRCPSCAAAVDPDFAFCHNCGFALRPQLYPGLAHMVYPPAYGTWAARPTRVLWGLRTKRGLVLTAISLILFWIPGLTLLAGLFLSVGSTMMFWDRSAFSRAHRSAMGVAFALLWSATALYVVLFLVFVGTAYAAWSNSQRMNGFLPAIVLFIWDSTAPTLLVVVALIFQVVRLLPQGTRRQLWAAGSLAASLVLLATVLAYLDVAAGIGTEFVRMSSVLGILNRISLARLVEGPGFVWLAWLYYVASRGIVPKTAPEGAPAPVVDGPPAN